MIFDETYQLPKPNGASDYNDSSHLAGLLAVISHPQAVDCRDYVVDRIIDRDTVMGRYTRHPSESRYDFSRDQAIMIMTGLIAQGRNEYVNLSFINGRDILPPSVRGLVRIANGKKPYWFQSLWLKGEIYWHSYLQPLDEPFQLTALCMTYDNFNGNNKLLKLWTELNNKWHWSIRRYLSELDGAWRGERELAEFIIEKIKEKI